MWADDVRAMHRGILQWRSMNEAGSRAGGTKWTPRPTARGAARATKRRLRLVTPATLVMVHDVDVLQLRFWVALPSYLRAVAVRAPMPLARALIDCSEGANRRPPSEERTPLLPCSLSGGGTDGGGESWRWRSLEIRIPTCRAQISDAMSLLLPLLLAFSWRRLELLRWTYISIAQNR